jgi:hypothetical protein
LGWWEFADRHVVAVREFVQIAVAGVVGVGVAGEDFVEAV